MMDDTFMRAAIIEGAKALRLGVMPVGAVMVYRGEVIARAHKTMASNHLDHAEMNLMRAIFQGEYAFERPAMTIYTTLEPCLMCYGTMRHCSIGRLVYALEDPYGGVSKLDERGLPLRHRTRPLEVIAGVLREDARQLFRDFLSSTEEPFWRNGGAQALQDIVLTDPNPTR